MPVLGHMQKQEIRIFFIRARLLKLTLNVIVIVCSSLFHCFTMCELPKKSKEFDGVLLSEAPQWLLGRGLLVISPTVRGLQSTVCFPSRGEAVVAERFFCYVTKGKLLHRSPSVSAMGLCQFPWWARNYMATVAQEVQPLTTRTLALSLIIIAVQLLVDICRTTG